MIGFGTVSELTRLDLIAVEVVVVVVLLLGVTVVLVLDVTSGPTTHAFSIDSTFTHLCTCSVEISAVKLMYSLEVSTE